MAPRNGYMDLTPETILVELNQFISHGSLQARISVFNAFTRNKHGVRRCGFDREDPYVKYELKGRTEASCKGIANGNDVLAVLPTRFGKSRIFNETNGRATIFVISPLGSIIKDQLNELRTQCVLRPICRPLDLLS